VGGRSNIRALWRHYYSGTEGIVFVIDSNDRERLEEAGEQLKRTLSEDLLLGIPVLILANKHDLPNALTINEIYNALQKNFANDTRKWKITETVGTTGVGLKEGMSWLNETINSKAICQIK
jgi:ADP-ribosylation factor protein 1